MKTALITGVTGYKVVALKRRTSLISTDRIDHIFDDEEKVLNFYLQYANMNDSGCLHRVLLEHQPDEIYNLAAQSHVRVSFETPEETTESILPRRLNSTKLAHQRCLATTLFTPKMKKRC